MHNIHFRPRTPLGELCDAPRTHSRMVRGHLSARFLPLDAFGLDLKTYRMSLGELIGPRDNVFPGPAVALDGPTAMLIIIIIIIIIRIIYLLNKAIIEKKFSNMNSRAGQQGKGTDSCPEIREVHKTIQQTKINIQNNICNHTNSK